MRYTLFLHYPEMTVQQLGEDRYEEGKAAFHAYAASLHDSGVLVSGEVLQPSSHSTTVTLAKGAPRVQDGPYADTKEQIGGTFVIDVPDLDAALAWAEKCPAAQWGTVEIRPSATRVVNGAWVAST